MSTLMTQAEYARHRGVSRQRVGAMVTNGKIPAAAIVEDGGIKKIDAAAADLALGASIERVAVRDDAPAADNGDGAEDQAAGGRAGDPFAGQAGGQLTRAKTATELYRARLAQLEYDQKIGRLVAIDDVTRSMQLAAEQLARDLDQLPARADDLATAFTRDGVDGVRKLLRQLARDVRAAMAANMRLLAQDPGDEPSPVEAESEAA